MTTPKTKIHTFSHLRMIPQREWDLVCMHIGIYPYPIIQKETEAQPLTMDNGHQAFLLEEAGGSKCNRMQCFYTASLEYCFTLALVSDPSGGPSEANGKRFLLYNRDQYQTLLFEEDIGDAAALIRLIVRYAGSIKGAEDCPIEIHDTTRFITTKKVRYDFNVFSFMKTGYTWYGGILPGLVPAKKIIPTNEPINNERDYRVHSIPINPNPNWIATKRPVQTQESHRLWNYGDMSYFNSHHYGTDVFKYVGTGYPSMTEWWILPAAAVRAFCAGTQSRRTRKMRRKV